MSKKLSFKEVKEAASLKDYAEAHLQRARKGNKYICPICGSGAGDRQGSDSAFSIRGDFWKCFSCGSKGDVFDLAGAVNKTEKKREELEAVALWAGLL